jgi:hypothetical protein
VDKSSPQAQDDERVRGFQTEHSDPLVWLDGSGTTEFASGKIAVLMPPPIDAAEEEPWRQVGFADQEHRAFLLLRAHHSGVSAVRRRSAYYCGPHIWPPERGEAFTP